MVTMQNFATQFFFWMMLYYVILQGFGAVLGATLSSVFSVALTFFAIACGVVVVLLLGGLFLTTDSMERF